MSFSQRVAERALVASGRHCVLCNQYRGTKIELHHIVPRARGGDDEFDNCIPLCFDCHADVEHYNPNHPRGRRFTATELRAHRDAWYERHAAIGSLAVERDDSQLENNPPVQDYDPQDVRVLLAGWVAERGADLDKAAVRYRDLDTQLQLPSGTVAGQVGYFEEIALQHGFVTEEKGPTAILFRRLPRRIPRVPTRSYYA